MVKKGVKIAHFGPFWGSQTPKTLQYWSGRVLGPCSQGLGQASQPLQYCTAGAGPMAHGPWPMAHGPWPMAPAHRYRGWVPPAHAVLHGLGVPSPCTYGLGPWAMGHGPWAMGHGPWAQPLQYSTAGAGRPVPAPGSMVPGPFLTNIAVFWGSGTPKMVQNGLF